jgi:hypothetical protein
MVLVSVNTPNPMSYLVSKNGQQQGPYTLEQINSLLQQGQLTPSDLVFTEGWDQWKKISELTTLPVTPPIPQTSAPTSETPKTGMSPIAKGCLIAGAVIICLGLIGFIGCVSCAGVLGSAATEGGGVSFEGQPVAEGRNISLNESISTDEFEFSITKVSVKRTIGDPKFLGSTAAQGGIYVCVLWKCKNVSNTSKSAFSTPRLNLFDSNGNKYDADIGASGSFAGEENVDRKVLSDLNPGITQTDSDVFEISEDILNSGGAYLEFNDAKGVRLSVEP